MAVVRSSFPLPGAFHSLSKIHLAINSEVQYLDRYLCIVRQVRSPDEKKSSYGLDVMVESAKRKDSKKLESARKSVCSAYSSIERNETPAPRYLLRSGMKENNKPPPGSVFGASAVCSDRRIGFRRAKNYWSRGEMSDRKKD